MTNPGNQKQVTVQPSGKSMRQQNPRQSVPRLQGQRPNQPRMPTRGPSQGLPRGQPPLPRGQPPQPPGQPPQPRGQPNMRPRHQLRPHHQMPHNATWRANMMPPRMPMNHPP